MKNLRLFIAGLSLFLFSTAMTEAKNSPTLDQLTTEISELVKDQKPTLIVSDPQLVTIHFQINARNEVVIFHMEGADTEVCAHVKKALNFKSLKFKGAKQLTPYVVNIRFEN